MMKKLKMRVLAIAAACALGLSGTGSELQLVYADTEDVEVEEDVIFDEGYVSEDGKWDCTLVKHEYESDGEGRQIVEISIESYRETVEYGATEITIPEKMRVYKDGEEELSEEYYVTRIESMDPSSSTKLNVSRTTSVTLPQTVISIGGEAFSWMTNLQEVKISPFTDDGTEQAVLESYWLSNCAGIGYSAFYKCERLTSVEVPSVTQEIGMNAFAKCERLESINLPNGVASIGGGAFAGCAFTEISLPESITDIGAGAFSGCDKLTAIEFPPELTELSDSIVSGCEALTEITVPEKVTSIGAGAFYCCLNLEEVTFDGDAVDTIGRGAFHYCESLTDISLPDTVTEIGEYAFSMCKNLASVKLPEQLTGIQTRCFEYCESLVSVGVPNSVEEIGEEAFYECKSLASIVVPDSVRTIGKHTFLGCESLRTVVIPKNTEFGYYDDIFIRCDWEALTIYTEDDSYVMENLDPNINFGYRCVPVHGAVSEVYDTEDGWRYMKDEEEGIKIVDYDGSLEDLVIPEFEDALVTSVSGRIWQDNTTIKSIQMPDTVTYIGMDAFNGCTGLTKINIPSALEYIGDNALKDCQPMKDTRLPDTIRYIGENSFCGWTELEKVVIPADVERLGENAFNGCTKLESVEFKGVAETDLKGEFYIGDSAFQDCNLKSLAIPGNCFGINNKAFAGNANLKTVVLPDDMYISDRVFVDCSALESINLPSALPNVCEYVFAGCEKLSRITIPEGVDMIDSGAFYGCTSLSEITIPDTVTLIYSNAFNGCSKLTDIALPKNLDKIGSHAFVGCTGISEITIPDTVTNIGKEAFQDCSSLTKVTIPSKTTLLGDSVFTGCPSLTIHTVSDSDALRYAKAYSIPYVLLDGGNGGEGDNDNPKTIDIAKATLTLSQTSYTYDGTAKTPTVTVTLDGKTLVLNTDYTVSYSNNTNAGTASVTVTGKGNYTGSKKADFTISTPSSGGTEEPVKADISQAAVTLSQTSYTYDGKAKTPSVTVKLAGKTLVLNTDYTVSYSNNTNVGTASVTVTGKGNYKGSKKVNFTIVKAAENPGENPGEKPDTSITCKKTVYNVTYGAKPFKINATSKGTLTFASSSTKVAAVGKNNGTVTIKGTGVATITVKAGNNSVKVTVKVSPKKASLSSAKAAKGKKLTVKWAKDKNASGYQVQVSTDKNFKKNVKQKNVTKTSYTFPKLIAGKKYYVRVRSYKKAGKETLYGAWSGKKQSGKVKK